MGRISNKISGTGEHDMKTFNLQADTYFVGDPCYAFSHDTNTWDLICNYLGHKSDAYAVPVKNGYVHFGNTYIGDGSYQGSDGVEYGVDAGLIGVVPIDLVEVSEEELKELGSIKTFDAPFTFSWKDGIFYIADIKIDTQNDEEGYEDEYDDET